MPSDDPSRSEPRSGPLQRLGGWLIRMGLKLGGEAPAAPREAAAEAAAAAGDPAAVDIVDQAEAFQTVRVSDAMTSARGVITSETRTVWKASA